MAAAVAIQFQIATPLRCFRDPDPYNNNSTNDNYDFHGRCHCYSVSDPYAAALLQGS